MPHLPDDATLGDYLAKGAVFAIAMFFAFCLIVLPIALLLRP